jgi:hypothetical protein
MLRDNSWVNRQLQEKQGDRVMSGQEQDNPKSPERARRPPPKLWFRMSIVTGNIVQLLGLVIGAVLLYLAARLRVATVARVVLMLLGWFVIYVCCHAIAHWAVGRLVGIRFRGYGLRGTDHPENYPPGLRQLMSIMPFFTVLTEKTSMQKARPVAKALMFSAGETSTTICSLLAAGSAWLSGTPGGFTLFVITIFWDIGSTIVTAIVPRGDYAKAIRVLRGAS